MARVLLFLVVIDIREVNTIRYILFDYFRWLGSRSTLRSPLHLRSPTLYWSVHVSNVHFLNAVAAAAAATASNPQCLRRRKNPRVLLPHHRNTTMPPVKNLHRTALPPELRLARCQPSLHRRRKVRPKYYVDDNTLFPPTAHTARRTRASFPHTLSMHAGLYCAFLLWPCVRLYAN